MNAKLKDVVKSANTGADAIQRAPIVEYDTGIKCLRIGDISNNRGYSDWGFAKVSVENYKRYKLQKGNILVARTGSTVGINKYIDEEYDSVYNNGLIRLEVDERYNSKFVYYILQTNRFKNYINGIAFGTTGQPNIQIEDLLNFEFKNFPIDIQNKIVKILYDIDQKIELNNQINENLLGIGDTIYKETFEKENLPKGWKICKLKDIAYNYDSKRKPMSSREREKRKGTYPYYGATSIIDYVDDYIFDGIYLLMGEDGTVVTDDGKPVLQYIWGKNWINNHAHVLSGNTISTEHLMFSLRNYNVRNIITGAVQPKINQENMNNIKVVLADETTNIKFEKIVDLIMKQYKNNVEQIQRLKKIRDTLLSKLMNGEIDLDTIEL